MRSAAEFPEVVEAVRAHASGCGHAIQADWQLFVPLAESLDFSVAQHTHDERAATEKFTGQVRRALNKLAADGTLVKQSDGHTARFYTPDALARHQDEQQRREAEQQALAVRVRDLRGRFRELGITGVSFSSNGRLTMDLDVATALVELAERATAIYPECEHAPPCLLADGSGTPCGRSE